VTVAKKEIKNRDEIIVEIGWPEFSFRGRCGKPVTVFLKKRKLPQPAKKAVWQANRIPCDTTDRN